MPNQYKPYPPLTDIEPSNRDLQLKDTDIVEQLHDTGQYSTGSKSLKRMPNFPAAATYLTSASSLSRVSSSIKLELYGLFKYVTVSSNPNTSRPSIIDMTGRAKWDAWAATAKKYNAIVDAEIRYLEIARSLGWSESVGKEQIPPTDIDLEHLSDGEDDLANTTSIFGLGQSVSRMARPDVATDNTLHGLVLACDVPGLVSLLDETPKLDLNALDEYGYAPIHLACDRGHLEVVRLLLSRGADRDIKDPDNLTALELSQEAGHKEIANLLKSHS